MRAGFDSRARGVLPLILSAWLVGCGTSFTSETRDAGYKSEIPDSGVVLGDMACDDGGACTADCDGPCAETTLAAQQGAPAALLADATHVYWTDTGAGTVLAMDLDGGALVTLASGQMGPSALAVDGKNLYWANSYRVPEQCGSPIACHYYLDSELMMAPLDGGAPTKVGGSQSFVAGIAVGPTALFWTASGAGQMTGGVVMSAPLDGGSATRLAEDQTFPASVAADAKDVYWVTDSAVVKVPQAGGSPATLADHQYFAGGIALDASHVYWSVSTDGVRCGSGAVLRAPLTGGAPETLASGQSFPTAIVVDDESVYWVNAVEDGSVVKAPLAGGAPTTLACGQTIPNSIGVSRGAVLWANLGTTTNGTAGSIVALSPR